MVILLRVGTNKKRLVKNIKKEAYWKKLIDDGKLPDADYKKVKK